MHSLLNAAFDIENVLGHGILGLTEGNALETNLQLNIVAGQIFSLANPLLKIENILCKINFSQGKIVNSHAEGCFGEMFGTVDINDSHACKLLLHGKMNDLIKHVPHEKMRKNLLGTFNRHQVVIAADLNHHPQKEELVGLVKIVDAEGKEQPLTFGCELTPGSLDSNLHQAIPCKLFTVNPVSFNFTSPETSLTLLDHDFYHLRHGWFEGDDLPLKKFIEPILTEIIPFNISGTGNLKGCFDRMMLNISYEAHHVCLENDLLVINVDEIKREPFKHNAEHFFDFRTGRHRGSLPLINATYLDKNTGLLFTDINADLHFAGNKMHVTSIESYCKGIYISGALDIDAYELTKGSFDLDIYPQTVYGKMTQVQNFFSHFNPTLFFLKLPIEGDVTLHEKGSHIHLTCTGKECTMQTHLRGALADGVIANDSNVALHELSLNFEYDQQANTLDFSEIQGTLLVGDPERVEEYTLIGEKIHFSDYVKNEATFDIWLGDIKA